MVYLTKYLLQLIHHYMAKVPLDPDNVWQYCAVIGPIANPVKRLIGGMLEFEVSKRINYKEALIMIMDLD